MRKLLIGAAGALAIAGCGEVRVTSNDADTQAALNQAQETARQIGDQAENVAADAGQEIERLGNRIDDIDVNINTNADRDSETANRQ